MFRTSNCWLSRESKVWYNITSFISTFLGIDVNHSLLLVYCTEIRLFSLIIITRLTSTPYTLTFTTPNINHTILFVSFAKFCLLSIEIKTSTCFTIWMLTPYHYFFYIYISLNYSHFLPFSPSFKTYTSFTSLVWTRGFPLVWI